MKITRGNAVAQLPRLWEITAECFEGEQLPTYNRLKWEFEDGDTWVVYNRDMEIVGYALVRPNHFGPREPLLQCIAILPKWRNNGLARFMLFEIEREYRGFAKSIVLHCKPDNPAVLLYGRAGYVVTRTIKGHYGSEGDGLEMEKIL